MTRRRVPVPVAVLSPRVVETLLGGWGAHHGVDDELFELYMARHDGIARLWTAHEAFLRAEAVRLGIKPAWRYRGRRYYFGEYVIRERVLLTRHADGDDPAA
jgi:hypothetical protein